MQEFQQEMMEAGRRMTSRRWRRSRRNRWSLWISSEMMTMSFKPMIVTFLPIILVFYWMGQEPHIVNTLVIPPGGILCAPCPTVAHVLWHATKRTGLCHRGWLGWYILCSFAMSQIFRKFMGLKGM